MKIIITILCHPTKDATNKTEGNGILTAEGIHVYTRWSIYLDQLKYRTVVSIVPAVVVRFRVTFKFPTQNAATFARANERTTRES